MADNDRNAPDDDLPEGDTDDAPKILGLPKPLFIKVAIGIVVLALLGGGGAFFFMGSDETPSQDEAAAEATDEFGLVSSLANASKKDDAAKPATNAELAEKVMVLREEAIFLREENIELREYILELKTQQGPQQNAQQDPPPNTQKSTDDQRKPDTAFLNNYGNDANAFPPIVLDPPKPRPEPRWGEFKRPAP